MTYVSQEARQQLLDTVAEATDEIGIAHGGPRRGVRGARRQHRRHARGGAVPAGPDGLRPGAAHPLRLRRAPRAADPDVRARVGGAAVAGRARVPRPRGGGRRGGRHDPRGAPGLDDARRGRRRGAAGGAVAGARAGRHGSRGARSTSCAGSAGSDQSRGSRSTGGRCGPHPPGRCWVDDHSLAGSRPPSSAPRRASSSAARSSSGSSTCTVPGNGDRSSLSPLSAACSASSPSSSGRRSAQPGGSTAPRQMSLPDRRSAVAIGSSGSHGWRVVRHWFSHTPSTMLASAHATSLAVVPSRRVRPKWSSAPVTACSSCLDRLRVLLHAGPADLLAPQAVRDGAEPQRPQRAVVHRRLAAVHRPARRLGGEDGVDPRVGGREVGGSRVLDRLDQSAALSASAIVSAWNAAWLPNRLLIAPRVLPSCAATALASSRANGPTAIAWSSSDSESFLICSSATSSPIST